MDNKQGPIIFYGSCFGATYVCNCHIQVSLQAINVSFISKFYIYPKLISIVVIKTINNRELVVNHAGTMKG